MKGEDSASTSRVAKALSMERLRLATPEEIQEHASYPCEVVFLLPNREMDYYNELQGAFAHDVAALLRLREVALYENWLSVRFLTFE